MSLRPIGILGALPEEITEILKHVQNPKKSKSSGHVFISGKWAGRSVVITLSGMGKVNAALTAQKLISDFGVSALIFSGVAGGIRPRWKVGDILVANSSFQHDVGFLGEKLKVHPPGVLPEIGIGVLESYKFEVQFDRKLKRALKQVEKNLEKIQVGRRFRHPQINFGTIATGDQFIASESKKVELSKMGADAVEMEGASVAQVGRLNQIPVVLIRAISDQAGSTSHVDFMSFLPVVAKNNARLVELFVVTQNARFCHPIQ